MYAQHIHINGLLLCLQLTPCSLVHMKIHLWSKPCLHLYYGRRRSSYNFPPKHWYLSTRIWSHMTEESILCKRTNGSIYVFTDREEQLWLWPTLELLYPAVFLDQHFPYYFKCFTKCLQCRLQYSPKYYHKCSFTNSVFIMINIPSLNVFIVITVPFLTLTVRYSLFWDVLQRRLAVIYGRFGTTCRSYPQE